MTVGAVPDEHELDALRQRGDQRADDLIAAFVQARGISDPKELVQRLIREHRTVPDNEQIPELRAYFDDPVALPAWVDLAVLREGQEFFRTFGVHIASALFSASLPMSYTGVSGAQVLMRTAELVSNTRRRLAQTGQMLLDVMGANDPRDAQPFAPDTAAYRAPHGVRLFHAAVRHLLRTDPQYDEAALGVPVNQEDLLGTLLVFTVVVIESLEHFGVPFSDAERDAYVHVWLTTGFLLGIEPALLMSRTSAADTPMQWDELCAMRDAITQRQAGPSASGQDLMHALLKEEARSFPPGLRGLPCACTRALLAPVYCDYLGVPQAGWTRVLLQPLPLVNKLLFRRRYYDLSGWLFARVTRGMYRDWIGAAEKGDANAHPWRYGPIARAWKLEPVHQRASRVARHPVAVAKRRRTNGTAFAAR
jgi:hypothetical protein